MSDTTVDASKRTWLIASGCAGVVGGAFTAVPFISSMEPSEKAKAAGAPVEIDISALQPGEKMTVEWRGKPVWILKRTPAMLQSLKKTDDEVADPNSDRKAYPTPAYAKNEWRSIKPEVLVVVGICTHLGCSPEYFGEIKAEPFDPNWKGGFFCPCHKSRYDISGRVFDGVPAPANLQVPPYHFVSDTLIQIGVDPQGAA